MVKAISMRLCFVATLALMLTLMTRTTLAAGTVTLSTCGASYQQDFDTLAATGSANTTVPTGWDFLEGGTNANTTYRASPGTDNTGDTYSFGAASNSERAFGGLRSGNLNTVIGAQFTNNTGATISELSISYTGEQWRLGQNTLGRAADQLDFQFSTDATSLSTGTWTDANSLDFLSPIVAGTVGSLNGNVAPNRTSLSFTITGLSIADGGTIWIRWVDADLIPGADDGLGIDDFSLSTVCDLCDGVTCPVNGPCGTYSCDPDNGKCEATFEPSGNVCRSALDVCDEEEHCTGSSVECPKDALRPIGTLCRAAVDDCDLAEFCDGIFASCPTDAYAILGTLCEDGLFCTSSSGTPGDADACDAGGICIGVSVDCDDGFYCTGTETCDDNLDQCVSSGDPCPGTDCNTCQEDTESCFDPEGTACGDLGDDVCDADDSCDGFGECLTHIAPDRLPCSDGLFCNGEERCLDGLCTDQADPCVDLRHCDEDQNSCLECVSDAECADDDSCTIDSCEEGQCTYRPGSHCVYSAAIDIKPGSCPNTLDPSLAPNSSNLPSVSVAILGSRSIQASNVDIRSIRISRSDGIGGAAAPTGGPTLEDVAGPAHGDPCQCVFLVNRDGVVDFVVQFSIARLNQEMRLQFERPGTRIRMILEGKLRDGTPFVAKDCIVIVRGSQPTSGLGNRRQEVIDK